MTWSGLLSSAPTVVGSQTTYPINGKDTIENENCFDGQTDQCSCAQNLAIVCAWQTTGATCVLMISRGKKDGIRNKLSRIYTCAAAEHAMGS
jgi:hypothetical protein